VDRVILCFSSTHAAIAAEDALREAGIPLQVIPKPEWLGAGCGLAFRLDPSVATAALEELTLCGVEVKAAREEPARDIERHTARLNGREPV
jgi:hypothetical protein